ncbi:MarR family winged helix-turn-helix transcriptional regulator [Methylobacterium oryzihabitans]|uniref:MarR family transcriptional regulator n=1 Tax=Methylobacterium oryzihabitans TaxID=2499852 RepID=A0A3S2YNE2_9HYPH|nr:MarR family winged helix-turn-helix transcriptional regulator [Methylobacterium oryzihabitans]RVU15162.1 MarR family transcriptional regulator [Methylobacterium oryzihabitans]
MTTPTADQIATLGAAFQAFVRRYKLADAGRSERPLNELDVQTLLYVAQNPDCGPTDIARYLGLAVTTISSATDRLAKRGLLERHRIEGDRRAVALRLSEDGAARAAAQSNAYDALNRTMLARLAPDERDAFIRMVAKIACHED